MSNPASAVFEKYAETGFYTATTAEPVITITVRDAKGSATTGADGAVTYAPGNVVFTYDSIAKNWKGGVDDTDMTTPGYYKSGSDDSTTAIDLDSIKDSVGSSSNVGDWMISVSNMSGYAIPAHQSEASVSDYLTRVITDVQLAWGNGKAAKRTVYMDSNIALTDGTDAVSSGKAKTIPNLYEAIQDMDTRIDRIDKEYGVSTADAGLFVTHHASGSNPYKSFIREDTTNAIEITAGNMLNADRKLNATEPGENYNMHFKANEITFTVTNPNSKVTAYVINEADMASATGTKINADDAYDTIKGKTGVNGVLTTTYYIIPLEDGEKDITTNPTGAFVLPSSLHCRVWRSIDYASGKSSTDITTGLSEVYTANKEDFDDVIAFLETSNGVAIEYMPHATLGQQVTTSTTKTDFVVASEMTYNLGAIIEAIQELNRRTMFMDTDMSFNGAMSYNDYSAETTPGSAYGTVIDGLPAGTDNNLHKAPNAA